jgi:uncharacterized protein (DUF427 family)
VAGITPPPERVIPGPGQESVWDYPRPPRIEPVPEPIRIVAGGVEVASTARALRVLETAGAPVYYLPPSDVRMDLLRRIGHETVCEFKGRATYYALELPNRSVPIAGWSYLGPSPGFESIAGHIAFYAWAVDEAWVGDELATPQPGRFYGGWITSRIVGPFKGGPGTLGW